MERSWRSMKPYWLVGNSMSVVARGSNGFSAVWFVGRVEHKTNFVDPVDRSIHTQSIESLWSRLKLFLRRQRLHSRVYLEEYLAEFTFRETVSDVFENLLTLMRAIN